MSIQDFSNSFYLNSNFKVKKSQFMLISGTTESSEKIHIFEE